MKIKTIILLTLAVFLTLAMHAQEVSPAVAPTATYIIDGEETVAQGAFDEQAPLDVTFRANPTGMDGYTPFYEWHFQKQGEQTEFMVRYEEDTQYTFTEAGVTIVTLRVKLNSEGDELPETIFTVTVKDSKLSFPNAFSPNGDDANQTFKAKECQSIVEFHAYIFNRWGQKLYEWTDPNGEWDGTYKGKPVKEGTYFLLVKAKGADGTRYNIRKDVNLLRGYSTEESLQQ